MAAMPHYKLKEFYAGSLNDTDIYPAQYFGSVKQITMEMLPKKNSCVFYPCLELSGFLIGLLFAHRRVTAYKMVYQQKSYSKNDTRLPTHVSSHL